MKKCKKCNTEKELECFYKNSSYKKGLTAKCKDCLKKESILRRKNNPLKIKQQDKERYERRKDKLKKYRQDNIEYFKERDKKYYEKNKERKKERNKKYLKIKKETDPIFKIKCNIRSLIFESYKKKGYKKSTKTQKILGCSWAEFKKHLESNPYGFYVGQENIDLDHIKPISKSKNEKEMIGLNHYSNFQLIPSFYNRHVKRDNDFDINDFEDWLKNNKI
jgi:hypothetical protein